MMLSLAMTSVAAEPLSVTVDGRATPTAFAHNWKASFGSGHASLTLRADWRDHLKQAVAQLGLRGVRYHGIFDDDMRVVTSPGVYNWTYVDSTWDYLISLGVRPIVELSFMPAFLANCSWHGHCAQDKLGCEGYWCTQCNGQGVGPIVNPAAPKCHSLEFWYQGIKQPPPGNDFSGWYDLVYALVSHAVQRYGLAEVKLWAFEVWNELWGMPFPEPYMALYNASARAVKAVDPSLRVGGPATAVLEHVADFATACKEGGVPYDFVTTHHYPTDGDGQFASKCPAGDEWDPNCFSRQVLGARASVAADEFYLTEYNVGCCLGYPLHDTPAAAAFVFRAVGDLNDEMRVYSYWTFTDVFEEGGLPRLEFKDVYGLMSVRGIPKPGWRAFQLLHEHAGSVRLPTTVGKQAKPTVTAWATANRSRSSGGLSGIRVFLSFWGNPDTPRVNASAAPVRLLLRHAAGAAPTAVALYSLDNGTDPRAAWDQMGAPAAPDPKQRAALMAASQVRRNGATLEPIDATTTAVSLRMLENSAVVAAFS